MKNCKNFWKRGISLALALMMCLSLLPVNAFAAEPPATITCGKRNCNETAHYVAEVPATCQEEGVIAHYECSKGHNTSLEGSYFWHEVTRIPRVGHNYNVKVSTTATCGKDGRATYKCEWCSRTTTKPDAATGEHSWSEWTPAADSKCSGTVEQTRECSECHKTEKQTVNATGEHSFVGGNCQTKSTCEVCGAEGNFGEHDFSVFVSTTATCGAAGKTTYKCAHCNATEERDAEATGNHSYTEFVSTTATCGAAGKATYKCANCDATEERDAEATGEHNYVGATCKTPGVCSGCGNVGETDPANHTGRQRTTNAGDGGHYWYWTCCETKDDAKNHPDRWEKHAFVESKVVPGLYQCSCGAVCTHEHKEYTFGKWTCPDCGATGTHACEIDRDNWTCVIDESTVCRKAHGLYEGVCKYCGTPMTWQPWGTGEHKFVGGDCETESTCEFCGTEGELGEHTLTPTEANPATCTEDGNIAYWTCETCGKLFSDAEGETEISAEDVVIEASGHTLTKTEAKTATCQETGNNEYWTCGTCDKVFKDEAGTTETTVEAETLAKDPNNHVGTATGKWIEVSGSDFVKRHVRKYSCCPSVTAESHEANNKVDFDEKYHWNACTVDGCTYTSYKTGHNYTSHANWQWDATYDSFGSLSVDWKCYGCEHTKTYTYTRGATRVTGVDDQGHYAYYRVSVTLPKRLVFNGVNNGRFYTDHVFGEWTVTTAPTATTAGEAKRDCQLDGCNKSETKVLPALGGGDSEWAYSVTRAPDCTNDGEGTYTYSDGTSLTVTIPALGHTPSSGWKTSDARHWHFCTRCKAQLDPASHTWDDGVVTTPATCEGEGVMTYSCTVCGKTRTEAISATGHTWGDWTVTTDPTADAEGAAERTCGTCGKVETKVLPALGGGEVANPEWTYEVTVEPGCTTDGVGTYTYTEDGSTVTVTIPATGHAWGDWTVALEPTYAAEGLEIRTCANCGETQTRVISALELPEGGLGGDTEEPEIEIEDEQTPLAGMPYALNPEDLLTRGHLMYVLHWFDGEPEAEISTFIDVAFEAYYSTAIGWAQDENIARGTPDNKFMPEDTVTRGQMEVFLTRYAEYLGLDMEVVLVGDDSDLMFWAEAETILNEFFASLPVEA